MATPYYTAATAPTLVGNPVVVQAQDVNAPGFVQEDNFLSAKEWTKLEENPRRCRDAIWGVLFYAHLIGMAVVAGIYMPQMISTVGNGGDDSWGGGNYRRLMKLRFLEEEDSADMVVNVDGVLVIVVGTGLVALFVSSMALTFMMRHSELLIKAALIFNIAMTLIFSMMALAGGNAVGGLMSFGLFFIVACYAYHVWTRIPFAASNLVTACTSVRANLGLAAYSYVAVFLSLGWSVWWTATMISTTFVVHECNAAGECEKPIGSLFIFVFAVSYYWTIQVIANVVHVTVAGTVATWWFAPQEAGSCCSRAVRESYIRSMTYSFGSICLGSLIVALVQALREVIHQARDSGDGMLLCCAECLVHCIESLIEYFNKWAFVYVGLYGFSFMEASKNVLTLFRTRGWTTIITDDLVDKSMLLVSVGIGLCTGIFGVLIGVYFDNMGVTIPFTIGFFLGMSLSGVLFSVVGSAVATVIVCYAEAPGEFQLNHPQLAENMRTTWRQAFPVEFKY